MNRYIFVLGTTTFELARAELATILENQKISSKLQLEQIPLVSASVSGRLDILKINSQLGGTVKIARFLGEITDPAAEELAEIITKEDEIPSAFGFSFYTPYTGSLEKLHAQVKTLLETKRTVRYVVPHPMQQLSSVVIRKQRVTEFIIFFDKLSGKWRIARTVVVQDADSWSGRDIGRPFRELKAGMLPPKVARMMVNLSLRAPHSGHFEAPTLVDPFCGMGTILQEALLVGFSVIGSDYDQTVIDKARKNIEWLRSKYRDSGSAGVNFIMSDATHLSEKIPLASVDAIVTEPFMGATFEKRGMLLLQRGQPVGETGVKNMLRGLEKLYIGALRDWVNILKPGGRVVIALPEIEIGKRIYRVKNPVDTREKLGYTLSRGPYIYARQGAIVRRQIYVFFKK